jgi:hypothetical protein
MIKKCMVQGQGAIQKHREKQRQVICDKPESAIVEIAVQQSLQIACNVRQQHTVRLRVASQRAEVLRHALRGLGGFGRRVNGAHVLLVFFALLDAAAAKAAAKARVARYGDNHHGAANREKRGPDSAGNVATFKSPRRWLGCRATAGRGAHWHGTGSRSAAAA